MKNFIEEFIKEEFLGGKPLHIGLVTEHPDDGRKVQITGGYFLDPTYGRVSNYWTWREVLPDGTLSETEESGYGWAIEEEE